MMNTQEQELKEILTGQQFDCLHHQAELLERRKRMAQSYAETENGIAVLSTFRRMPATSIQVPSASA